MIHDVGLHQKASARWASLPSNPTLSRDGNTVRDTAKGRPKFVPVIEFKDKATRDRFSLRVVEAVIAVATDACAEMEAAE